MTSAVLVPSWNVHLASVTQHCQRWQLCVKCVPTAELLGKPPAQCHNEWRSTKAWPESSIAWCHLDRTLSYNKHLSKTAAKLKSCNNLVSKLAGSSWGVNTKTIHTSAIAVCYSVLSIVVELGRDPVTRHPSTVNNTMWLISGCIQPTQIPMLVATANLLDTV